MRQVKLIEESCSFDNSPQEIEDCVNEYLRTLPDAKLEHVQLHNRAWFFAISYEGETNEIFSNRCREL